MKRDSVVSEPEGATKRKDEDDDMDLDDGDSEGDNDGYEDDVLLHLYERPAPTMEDFGSLNIVGTSRLNTKDKSPGEEKLDIESFDPE
nr:hypothetical protein [Tanacetum cinerariifolium]